VRRVDQRILSTCLAEGTEGREEPGCLFLSRGGADVVCKEVSSSPSQGEGEDTGAIASARGTSGRGNAQLFSLGERKKGLLRRKRRPCPAQRVAAVGP